MNEKVREVHCKFMAEVEKKLIDSGYLVHAVHRDGFDYFTVQDKDNPEPAQIYVQIAEFPYGFSLASKYKPSKGEGSGRIIMGHCDPDYLYEMVIEHLVTADRHADKYGRPKPILESVCETK